MWSAGHPVRVPANASHSLQVAFPDYAFVGLAQAFNAVLQLAAVVGKQPDDLVIACRRRTIKKVAAETHTLPGSKSVCHICSNGNLRRPRPLLAVWQASSPGTQALQTSGLTAYTAQEVNTPTSPTRAAHRCP